MDQEFKKKISLLGGLCLLLLTLIVMLDKIKVRQVVQKRATEEVVDMFLGPSVANITTQGTRIDILMGKHGVANKNVRGAEVVVQLDTQSASVFEVTSLACGTKFPRKIVGEVNGPTISLACSQQTGGVAPVVLGAEVLGSFVLKAKSGATEGTQGYLHLISGHIPLAGGDYHNLMGAGTGGLYTVAAGPPITPTATATPLPGCPVCPSNITLESVARVPNNGKYNIRVRWPNHPDSRGYDVYRQIGSGVWEYAALVVETTATNTYLDQSKNGQGFAPGLLVRYRLNPRKATCPSLTCPATSPITVGPIPTATPTGPTATPTLTCVDGCYNHNPQSLAVCNNNCQTKTGHNCILIEQVGLCAWAPAYRCCFFGPGPSITVSPTVTPIPTVTPGGPTVTPMPTVTPGGPTLTPLPTVTPLPTATPTIGGTAPTLNFSVKFQGITTKRADQKVKVRVKKGTLDLSFPNVTVTANSAGIYSGSVVLTGVSPEDKYTIFIKGPKHLARKFCANNQTARCLGEGNITLVAGNNTFDFSKLILEGGDLPNPNENNRQDGVANSVDWSLIKNRLGSTAAADLVIADINLDEQVNSIDQILMRNTLETKYEEED